MSSTLTTKIKEKTAVIGVIGLGYVGLPLAVEKAKAGYRVIGFDIQEEKVTLVNKGKNYIGDIVDNDLAEMVKCGNLCATADYTRIKDCDAMTICVPTPLDEHYQPDISYVENSAREIAKYLKSDTLVVLESTTYPGTTEEVVMPILEENGLQCGKDFYLAFSPERVDPGNKLYNTKNTPKVVGGVTRACTDVAALLYESVLDGEIFRASSPKVAEMEKLLENTYRNINIGLANEMAILCNRMGINVWEVIDAAKTKPYGFQAFYPGPGLGGHCIPIDPFYLTWKAREFDYHTRLIEVSAEINQYMPEYVVERVMKILNESKMSLNGANVLVLGVAYKQDIDDLRESPALKVIEHLERYRAVVNYSDPYISQFSLHNKHYRSVMINERTLSDADIVIITTMHTAFDYQFIADHSKIVFDTKNATKGIIDRDGTVRVL